MPESGEAITVYYVLAAGDHAVPERSCWGRCWPHWILRGAGQGSGMVLEKFFISTLHVAELPNCMLWNSNVAVDK